MTISLSQIPSKEVEGKKHGPQPPILVDDRQRREERMVQGRELAKVLQVPAWVLLANTFIYSKILSLGQDRRETAF